MIIVGLVLLLGLDAGIAEILHLIFSALSFWQWWAIVIVLSVIFGVRRD